MDFQSAGPRLHLLAVGRLVREKGFDLLLTAFAKVREQFPHAHLTILGEGIEEASLKAMRCQLGISADVSFPGYVDHPEEWFPKARLFVLSSRQEAMPNALLEAASYGLPIVATPALGDATVGLRGMPGCWIAEECSAQALAESLCEALNTLSEMQRIEHAWIAPFRMENALSRHEALIDEVLTGARA
jgi:glycosyltransferase involved in cell wall biosynthesis